MTAAAALRNLLTSLSATGVPIATFGDGKQASHRLLRAIREWPVLAGQISLIIPSEHNSYLSAGITGWYEFSIGVRTHGPQ